jgi:hypothetical protein
MGEWYKNDRLTDVLEGMDLYAEARSPRACW